MSNFTRLIWSKALVNTVLFTDRKVSILPSKLETNEMHSLLESLVLLSRFAFSFLAFFAFTKIDIEPNDVAGVLWILASLVYLSSIVIEMVSVSDRMTKVLGGYIINSIGAVLFFIASVMYLIFGMGTGSSKDLVAGFTLSSGLVTFIAQFIIAFQFIESKYPKESLFLFASAVGALASFMYILGGIFAVEDVSPDSADESDNAFDTRDVDFEEHTKKMWQRFPVIMAIGSIIYLLHTCVLGNAFASNHEGGGIVE